MNTITGNEPSMPTLNAKELWNNNPGLSIRQQFAMAAMQGMIANPEFVRLLNEHVDPADQATFLAAAAVEQGDALIAELNKPQL